jgi:hypothetical protein
MVILFTFIVAYATVHGMSFHLSQYLFYILDARRKNNGSQFLGIIATG